MLLPLLVAMVSCNGIFGGIYDHVSPTEDSFFGFIEEDSDGQGGLIYLFLNVYERWTYIDFHNQTIDTLGMHDGEPAHWDVAMHRYDARTNGGAVAATPYSDLAFSTDATLVDGLDYVADVDSQVVVDISQMMDGILGYEAASVNPVLSHWMDVDLGTMPPVYTPAGTAYVVQMADGTRVALIFEKYMNEQNVKGYVTIRYRYPV